jgi:hypothetical protein
MEVNPAYGVIATPRINEIKTLINGVYSTTTPSPKDVFALITMQLASSITDAAIEHLKDVNNIKEESDG